jgi:hypothetical protein
MEINQQRWGNYKKFHEQYVGYGDCDPAYPMLKFISEELGMDDEDKYFMAWVYSSCYNDCTTFYIMKNLPKYKEIDPNQFDSWWKKHRPKMIFTTDRAKVKNFNKFPIMFKSYRQLVGLNQKEKFNSLLVDDPVTSYNKLYKFANQFYYFGRFSLFLYLEILNILTNIPISIDNLELEKAESCRNGLCYAIGKDDWSKRKLSREQYSFLYDCLHKIMAELKEELTEQRTTYWNVETSLCAYKKLFWETRYLGYYIDRSLQGLYAMQKNAPELDWKIFFNFRKKFFKPFFLGEIGGWRKPRRDRYKIFNKYNNSFIYPYENIV